MCIQTPTCKCRTHTESSKDTPRPTPEGHQPPPGGARRRTTAARPPWRSRTRSPHRTRPTRTASPARTRSRARAPTPPRALALACPLRRAPLPRLSPTLPLRALARRRRRCPTTTSTRRATCTHRSRRTRRGCTPRRRHPSPSPRTGTPRRIVGLTANRPSDWSTRFNHNTIVYQYRSCTQCRCIVPAHYTHSGIQCRGQSEGRGCGARPVTHLHVPSVRHVPVSKLQGRHSVKFFTEQSAPSHPPWHLQLPLLSQSPCAQGRHLVKQSLPVHCTPSGSE